MVRRTISSSGAVTSSSAHLEPPNGIVRDRRPAAPSATAPPAHTGSTLAPERSSNACSTPFRCGPAGTRPAPARRAAGLYNGQAFVGGAGSIWCEIVATVVVSQLLMPTLIGTDEELAAPCKGSERAPLSMKIRVRIPGRAPPLAVLMAPRRRTPSFGVGYDHCWPFNSGSGPWLVSPAAGVGSPIHLAARQHRPPLPAWAALWVTY